MSRTEQQYRTIAGEKWDIVHAAKSRTEAYRKVEDLKRSNIYARVVPATKTARASGYTHYVLAQSSGQRKATARDISIIAAEVVPAMDKS